MGLPPDLAKLAARVSTWGKWGAEDRRGTLNYLDDAAVARGLAAARTGKVFSLALPFGENGPQMNNIPGRNNPVIERNMVSMTWTGSGGAAWSDDHLDMGIQACTHWDTLSHCGYDGVLYNNVPSSVITAEEGATTFNIGDVGTVVSRGVLLDVARALGLDRLPGSYEISGADLEAARQHAGVELRAGDVLLVRTGQLAVFKSGERDEYSKVTPGIATTAIEWLVEQQCAAVAIDTLPFEPIDHATSDFTFPVQMILIRDVGMLLGELWDFDELAADCAKDGIYDCLLVANPLPIVNGIGGPLAPVAIK